MDKIRFKSFVGTAWHNISLSRRTCDCLQFQSEGHCEHLEAFGVYRLQPFVPKTHPSFSQALSGLVKSIRLRRIEDAGYWLLYLDTFKEAQYRFRTARRLLIGSAEDGHSVPVMEAVRQNFWTISKPETELLSLVAEAVRICKIPNWWHPATGGPGYIYSGMVGQRDLAYFHEKPSRENMAKLLEQGIDDRNKRMALAGVMGLSETGTKSGTHAELILALARKHRHLLAGRLAQLHLSVKAALSNDNNFLCQAAWMMAGGVSPVADKIEPVTAGECQRLIEKATERWKNPQPIPGWCCDGVHSAGNDVRFMGMWQQMYAACRAYQFYGRVNPDDEWLPEFQCYDGLVFQEV